MIKLSMPNLCISLFEQLTLEACLNLKRHKLYQCESRVKPADSKTGSMIDCLLLHCEEHQHFCFLSVSLIMVHKIKQPDTVLNNISII